MLGLRRHVYAIKISKVIINAVIKVGKVCDAIYTRHCIKYIAHAY